MEFKTNGIRADSYCFNEETIKKLQATWKHFYNNIENYPQRFQGRGIVLTAGGIRYTTCAWVAINMRKL